MEEEGRVSRSHTLVRYLFPVLVVVLAAGFAVFLNRPKMMAARSAQPAPSFASPSATASQAYPYGSPTFTQFVADSYRENNAGDPRAFYRWMDQKFRAQGPASSGTWDTWLAAQRRQSERTSNPVQRAKAQMALGATIHKTIKRIIPKFSLDEGFEFTNTVSKGERQCFLQSVLIAGLMQKAGVDAGVVMVNRNDKEQYSNNGHAVVLAHLADGRAVLVDASDPQPFVHHTGLMVDDTRADHYRYVEPVYDASSAITAFTTVDTSTRLKPRVVRTLPVPFVRSQFEYYRGERTPGGPFLKPSTKAGLEASAAHLRRSVKECPDNPLAVYMLGTVEFDLGNHTAARKNIHDAHRLYADYGWMPQGARDMMAKVE